MTENPIEATFELQRTAIEQSRQATVEVVEAQKTAVNAFVDGLETSQDIQQQTTQLTNEAAHSFLDAIEQVNPEADLGEVRTLVDDGFQNAEETQEEVWKSLLEAAREGVDTFGEAADTYGEFVDSAFDSYLAAHEQVEATAGEFEEIDVTPS